MGCGGQKYWPFGGTSCCPVWPPVVPGGHCWACWYLSWHRLYRASPLCVTVGRWLPIGRHAPNLTGGRWNRPGIGWGRPVEGQAPIGPTKSPPGAEGSGVCPILTRRGRLSVDDLSAIIHRLVSRGLVCRISAFCAPRVPWSDMKLSLRDAPTSHRYLPQCTSCFCCHCLAPGHASNCRIRVSR